ncbi:hypothetical protein EZ100_22725 [Salmonella enterica]|nr:hypothetical protein [Salmonella enterica]
MKGGIVSVLTITTLMLTGCDSSKDASEGNFTKVINDKLSNKCISFSPAGLFNMSGYPKKPFTIVLYNSDDEVLDGNAVVANAKMLALPEALVKAGLLTSQDKETKKLYPEKILKAKEYTITEEGKKYLQSENSPNFCIGHYKVDEIIDFTEPSETLGIKMSHVNYMYSPTDIPDWAKNKEIKENVRELADGQKNRITLVLKNTGWSAEN